MNPGARVMLPGGSEDNNVWKDALHVPPSSGAPNEQIHPIARITRCRRKNRKEHVTKWRQKVRMHRVSIKPKTSLIFPPWAQGLESKVLGLGFGFRLCRKIKDLRSCFFVLLLRTMITQIYNAQNAKDILHLLLFRA